MLLDSLILTFFWIAMSAVPTADIFKPILAQSASLSRKRSLEHDLATRHSGPH